MEKIKIFLVISILIICLSFIAASTLINDAKVSTIGGYFTNVSASSYCNSSKCYTLSDFLSTSGVIDNGINIKYQNISNIPTCTGTRKLSYDGSTLSCENDVDTTNHASFSNLDYASAGHTGFQAAIAAGTQAMWYNHTINTFNLYNSTWDNSWLNIFGYNHTLAIETLYGKWFYNMSDGSGLGNSYNETYDLTTRAWNGNWTDYNKFWYNMTGSVGSSYNATYATWAYNQSESPTITKWLYNMTIFNSSIFNATYDKWAYNMTIFNNSIYNSTYATWSYNQSLSPTITKWLYNMTIFNSSIYNSTYDAKVSFPGYGNIAMINVSNNFAENQNFSKNITIQTNQKFCFDGDACTKYQMWNGSNIVIQG